MKSLKKILIIGGRGGTNVGQSFELAAKQLKYHAILADSKLASSDSKIINALSWRFYQKKPPKFISYNKSLISLCERFRPDICLSTGMAPVSAQTLKKIKNFGVICVNFSTDDPWNPSRLSNWHNRALLENNIIFTPRINNINDFISLGCADVRYLPFCYDSNIFSNTDLSKESKTIDVLFVGGADPGRVLFIEKLINQGISVKLIGAYWDRYKSTANFSLGHLPPNDVIEHTKSAKINLCLVRRSNRDGHVMRSFEIAALGGCMLAEYTPEHEGIFGQDNINVQFFNTSSEAVTKIKFLLSNPLERERLSKSVRNKICSGGNTYIERLESIINASNYYL